MSEALVEGIGMGLILSAMIGPVFFTLIQNSLENGFRHTAILALGILLSDLIYIVVTFFGVSLFAKNPLFEIVLGYAGGLILVGFGVATILKKNKSRPNSGGMPVRPKKRRGFLKGFSINGVNPFVLLFWISIAGLVNLKPNFTNIDVGFYYAGILLTVFSIDLLKAYIAKRLSSFVTPTFMNRLNVGVGVFLIFFGARLFVYAMQVGG